AFLVERCFDYGDEIAEVDGKAVMRAAGDEPDSIRQLLRLRAHGRRRCFLYCIRHCDGRDTDTWLDVGQRDLPRIEGHAQSRVTLVDMEHGGVFHAAEI